MKIKKRYLLNASNRHEVLITEIIRKIELLEIKEYAIGIDRVDLYNKALKVFGYKNQLSKASEELKELLDELPKIEYNRIDKKMKYSTNLLTELADVTIMIEQIMNICSITKNELDFEIEKKLLRLENLIENEAEN